MHHPSTYKMAHALSFFISKFSLRERRVGILVVGGKLATFKKSFENVLENLKKTLMDLPEQNKCGKKLSFLLNIIPLFFIINRSNPYGRKRGYCCLGNKLFAYQTLREKRPYSEFSGPHFPAFGLNTERYSVSVSIRMREMRVQTFFTQLEFCSNTFAWLRMVLLLDWSGPGQSLFLFH